ncbi:MAG: PEP/pyruvate-binding domain-containing protein [Stenotrophomonas sp.]
MTFTLLLLCVAPSFAQTARKPSPYEYRQSTEQPPPPPSAGPDALARIDSREQFMQLARVYNAGTPLEMPHLIFVIDRHDAGRIYYINTPRHALHEQFVRQRLGRSMDKATLNAQYRDPQRRFLFGTLAWQRDLPGYTYEFWEGDRISAALLRQTDDIVRSSFYDPIRFKTNATGHEQVARAMGLAYVSQEALLREQRFLPLNTGRAEGRLRIVRSDAQLRTLSPTDIPVLDEVPIALAPVAGLVTQRPSTLLSHVNLLAKGWGIPNAYVRDAKTALRQYDGRWVALEVSSNDYRVTPIARPARTPSATAARPVQRNLPRPDLSVVALKPLAALRARDSSHCGVKAANLGTLKAVLPPAARVPDGFCVPFSHYQAMQQRLKIPERLRALQQRPGFGTDPEVRRAALAGLRAEITNAAPDAAFVRSLQAQWQGQLKGAGVFVRSSSNSEDLPGFSGAGLYTTVPNVTRADAMAEAVQAVWASIYNFEAYEARTAAGLQQDAVAMAVLVQVAAPSDSSGVMITRDPFDRARQHATYISAKRGLGIRVVEGKRQAEQVMYSNWSKAVQVLSRSAEDTQLVAKAGGGVREVPITGSRQVLTDALVARLAKIGAATRQALGGVDQDIEWAVVGDEVLVLQSRPYVDGSAR